MFAIQNDAPHLAEKAWLLLGTARRREAEGKRNYEGSSTTGALEAPSLMT